VGLHHAGGTLFIIRCIFGIMCLSSGNAIMSHKSEKFAGKLDEQYRIIMAL
jgi:hypothetical protein